MTKDSQSETKERFPKILRFESNRQADQPKKNHYIVFMNKNRLEAFSDGVLAIIITIMVLEMKVPHSADWRALLELAPVFGSYVLSFAFVGIYWNNHHHLLHTVQHLNPSIMWSNLNLLFWLSLIPFGTAWMGENSFSEAPVVIYACLLLLCGYSYDLLRKSIIKSYKDDHALKHALEKQTRKAIISTISYSAAIPTAFLHTGISVALFIFVALIWIIPSREIEKSLSEQ